MFMLVEHVHIFIHNLLMYLCLRLPPSYGYVDRSPQLVRLMLALETTSPWWYATLQCSDNY